MSNAPHTPGPWEIVVDEKAESPHGMDSCLIIRDVVTDDDMGRHIAFCFNCPDDPETQSNARLIAASPDLLAALKGIVEQACVNGCEELGCGFKRRVVHSAECTAARAAIKRATVSA